MREGERPTNIVRNDEVRLLSTDIGGMMNLAYHKVILKLVGERFHEERDIT